MRRLVITDSGLGGLAVGADLLRHPPGLQAQQAELLYVNAAPDPQRGYNSMPTLQEKQQVFQRFLHNLAVRYQPDQIFVACHTLSTLLPQLVLPEIPIQGMVSLTRQTVQERARQLGYSQLLVLATATTVASRAYSQLLSKTLAIACPGLADTISSDLEGTWVIEKIQHHLHQVKEEFPTARSLVLLGCTHYGWREDLFLQAFQQRNWEVELINPNRIAAAWLAERWKLVPESRFISAYPTPLYEQTTLQALLQRAKVPSLVQALSAEEQASLFE